MTCRSGTDRATTQSGHPVHAERQFEPLGERAETPTSRIVVRTADRGRLNVIGLEFELAGPQFWRIVD